MSRFAGIFGFPVYTGYCFRFRGNLYRLGRADVRELRLLARLANTSSDTSQCVGWLLPYRPEFRRIIRHAPRAMLAHLILHTKAIPLRRLAIWLSGRCGGTLGTSSILEHAQSCSVVLRREVARALKRKHGWSQLADIAARDPDDRVRTLAAQEPPEPFGNRLTQFLDDVTPRTPGHSRQTLAVVPDVDTRTGRPPKTPQLIRYFLERIRWLVHGHVS